MHLKEIPEKYKKRIILAESDTQFETLRSEVEQDSSLSEEEKRELFEFIQNTRLALRISELEDEEGRDSLRVEIESHSDLSPQSKRALLFTLDDWVI